MVEPVSYVRPIADDVSDDGDGNQCRRSKCESQRFTLRCAGAKVRRCVLFEYTRIAPDMEFTEMIVSPDYCVDRSGDTFYLGDERTELRWGDARA